MAVGAAVFLLAEGIARTEAGSGRGVAAKVFAPVAWLGRHSYELYLFHIVLLAEMRTVLPRSAMAPATKPLWLAAFIGISALVAWGIARFYSEPLNYRLRARLIEPRKTGPQLVGQ